MSVGSTKDTRFIAGMGLTALLVVILLICSSCSSNDGDTLNTVLLDKVISDFMEDHHFPGAVVGAWVPGKGNYVAAKGKSNLETDTAMKIEYKFGIASVTKSFVGTVALQLVDEGKLELDDSLSKYISDVPNAENITIRQILNMTSGLFDYLTDEDFMGTVLSDPSKKWAPEELVAIGVSHEPYFASGEGWRYSNTNTILVGMIIELITGNKLADEIQGRISDKLGLKNTLLPDSPAIAPPYAHGYMYDEGVYIDTSELDPSFAWAAGAMVSNLEDLKIWAEALATGKLISASMQKERLVFINMFMPGVPDFYNKMDPKYGLAMEQYDNSFVGHSGKTLGYNAQMYYLPSENAILITLLNTDTTTGDGPLFFATLSKIIFPGSFSKLEGSL